jgi:heptose I phosphotransferase
MNVECLDQGRMTVTSEFLPLLRANGLDEFEKVMAFSGGTVVRDFPGRRTARLELKTPTGAAQGVFLKRYEPGYLSAGRRLLRFLHWPGSDDEAMREWSMIQKVAACGIPTATPIAVGQQRSGGMVRRSFVMTAELAGAVEGQIWMERLPAGERRRFLIRVAEMARRFHGSGLVHKDFYIGHVLVAPKADEAEFFLIDLQRVAKPALLRSRWIAKDLGSLAYSMFNAGATYTDLLRALAAYRGHSKLDADGKQAARAAFRRLAWLRTRQPKHGAPVKHRL